MKNVCIFYDHLEYFMAIRYNLWLFGIVCGHLVYFSHFGMFGPRKIWQPCSSRFFSFLSLIWTCTHANECVTSIEILVLERVRLHWSGKHFWQKKLLKSLLISTQDKAFYYKGTFL
jgi:hypothetical protein